ncbi:MAG TPA: cyclase family protein [Terriglobales bacterium]|nr:cyclase family protein [Terriglobales bacterium]
MQDYGKTAVAFLLLRVIVLAFLVLIPSTPAEAQLNQRIPSSGWIDVSVAVDPAKIPVYAGDPEPQFTLVKSMAKGDKLNLSDLHMGVHTGTHIDAPLHFIADGGSVDRIPLENLIGPALVIECSRSAAIVDAAELNRHDWRGAKRLLFKTRNSYDNFWNDKTFHKDYVAFAPDAAQLLGQAGVELVGIDYLSAEKFGSPEPKAHLALLSQGVVIVEGLDLRPVMGGNYDMIALPVKLAGIEGSPTRVVLRKSAGERKTAPAVRK